MIFLSISGQAPYKVLQTAEQTLAFHHSGTNSPPIQSIVAIPTFRAITSFLNLQKNKNPVAVGGAIGILINVTVSGNIT